MRIGIGSLQCESNTISPLPIRKGDFDIVYGMDMLKKIDVGEMLYEKNVDVVPTLYAHALPGGPVAREDYLEFVNGMINTLPEKGLDGIWLYLHGAMYVEELGSGETYLLREIRRKVGFDLPIAVAMDFHANNTDELFTLANIICGFRTAPHRDRVETQQKAMHLLFHCINKQLLPKPKYARANVVQPGNCVQTEVPPLCNLIAEADAMEKMPGVLCAQFFNGQPWVDVPYMGPSTVVICEHDTKLAKKLAEKLARHFYDMRYDFHFQVATAEPEDAIRKALSSIEAPVFISDSGDNTTAGATGDSAFMLNLLLKMKVRNALVAGITDKAACDVCYSAHLGETITIRVGGSLSSLSESIFITGQLTHQGNIISYLGGSAGRSATLLCNGVTVVVTENRVAITSQAMFESIGIDITSFKIIVVKLGYLFPGLAAVAREPIFAFTPGSSPERLEDMRHKHIKRPMYPLDDNFM